MVEEEEMMDQSPKENQERGRQKVRFLDRIAYWGLQKWKKIQRVHLKGWLALTCMVFRQDSANRPHTIKINYFLLFFIACMSISMISGAVYLSMNRISLHEQKNLQDRQVILTLLLDLVEEKKNLLDILNIKQNEISAQSYGGSNWQNSLQPYQLANVLLIDGNSHQKTTTNQDANLSTIGSASGKISEIFDSAIIRLKEEARPHLYSLYQKSLLNAAIPYGWALKNKVGILTSGFGYRTDPLTGQREMHAGSDFAAVIGTPIIATSSGRVYSTNVSNNDVGYGRYIKIRHGFGYVTLYAHCRSIIVRNGDWIKRGQVIGYLGATGRVTGPHLHYEVRLGYIDSINPKPFINLDK